MGNRRRRSTSDLRLRRARGWSNGPVPEPAPGIGDVPRRDDWSLRAALVRFAQPEPVRAGAVLELVRRTDGALRTTDEATAAALAPVVADLDAIADALVAWAVDRGGPPPVAVIDDHAAAAHARLEALGVRREDGPPRPPPGSRRRG